MNNTKHQPLKQATVSKSMTQDEWIAAITQPLKKAIGSNSKLSKSNIWQWSIPAYHAAVVKNGKLVEGFKTCPTAGECAGLCYAQQGGFIFKASMIAHSRNLQAYIDHPGDLKDMIINEILSKKKLKAFRIHDSGDFFNLTYATFWMSIVKALPHVQFYAYTKQVSMFKGKFKSQVPSNMSIIFSYGGKQDHLIDPETDRHSKVFKTYDEMVAAGYSDTTETDDCAADPSIKNIGLVYHGVLGVEKAFNNATMGVEVEDTLVQKMVKTIRNNQVA